MRLYPAYIAYILNCRWTREAQGWANVPSLPKETRDAVIAEMLGLLKTLVDQWIESGKNIRDANVENPWERSIAWTSPLRPNPISTVLLLYDVYRPPSDRTFRDDFDREAQLCAVAREHARGGCAVVSGPDRL
jgi:hypothetical protein